MICIVLTSILRYEFNFTVNRKRQFAKPCSELLEFRGERQQRDVLRALNGHRQPALMSSAGSGHAARKDLASLLNKRRQDLGLLVIDEVRLIDAKATNLLFANEAALSAFCRSTGSAGASSGTARPAAWS
jgi:hypothetical protein